MGNRTDGKMTGEEKKKRDPIFSACFVVFILAAVAVVGVYVDEHYLTEDNTTVAYGDTVHVKYTGTFYDYAGSDSAVEFDSGDDLDFDAETGSDVLAKFWQACMGHKVGDTIRVTIDPTDGYIAGAVDNRSALTGLTMDMTQTMTETQFENVYDYDLTAGSQTPIKTVYGWNALATLDSASHTVTLLHIPSVGEYTYTLGDEGEEGDDDKVTTTFKVTSTEEGVITYDIGFEGYTTVDAETGEVQMFELQFGDETWQVTNITDGEFHYKTCADTRNQTLYFVIEITSIS